MCTSKISKYVDLHLQPSVRSLTSHIKDTTDFINKITQVKNIPDDAILVSMDVRSLYTNIPNDEGVNAVKEALDKEPNKQPLSTKRNTNKIQLITTYNRTLPNVQKAIEKHWHLLKINNEISKVFTEKSIIAYRRNKNIQDLTGSNTIENNKVKRKRKVNLNGSCSPCLSKYGNLCCKQVVPTTTFKSQINGKSFKIQHRLKCHSENVIYLMECRMCSIKYVWKSETPFNIRLNNQRKDVKSSDSIPACQHFNNNHHEFNRDVKFTLIEQLRNTNIDPSIRTKRLKEREDFWIKTFNRIEDLFVSYTGGVTVCYVLNFF